MKTLLSLCSVASAFVAAAAVVVPFSPKDGEIFQPSVGGKLIRVDGFAPNNGSVALKSIYKADVTTNAVETIATTNFDYTVITSNTVSHVCKTNTYANTRWRFVPDVISVTTNAHVKTVTRSWPVFKETVAVTNDISSGTASSKLYSETLETPAYIAPGESILFTGTAVGGWIRLIFE